MVARLAGALLLAAPLVAVSGCADRQEAAQALPAAEFLFAAGDSTYWVRSSGDGMRVRSAPILLTQVDGGLVEIFITDDGAEYPDASFATVRLWARALQSSDSTLLFADSTVLRELAAWRRAHPRETEVDPLDEETPEDPRTVVQDEVEILEDLLLAAHNDAKAKVEAIMQEKTKALTAGLPIPPGMKLPF